MLGHGQLPLAIRESRSTALPPMLSGSIKTLQLAVHCRGPVLALLQQGLDTPEALSACARLKGACLGVIGLSTSHTSGTLKSFWSILCIAASFIAPRTGYNKRAWFISIRYAGAHCTHATRSFAARAATEEMSDEDAGPSGPTGVHGRSSTPNDFLLDDKIGVIGAGQVRRCSRLITKAHMS